MHAPGYLSCIYSLLLLVYCYMQIGGLHMLTTNTTWSKWYDIFKFHACQLLQSSLCELSGSVLARTQFPSWMQYFYSC